MEAILGRFKLLDHWQKFTQSLRDVTTPQILISGMVNTAFAFMFMFGALYLALRGVGAGNVPPATLVLAFALPTMLGRISALPGGVGVTEAGMVGILDQAAAAVTVFRLGTVLFAALVGGLVYLFGWRGAKEKAAMDADANKSNDAGKTGERGAAATLTPVPDKAEAV